MSRQGYYTWLKRGDSKTTICHQFLKQEIQRVFDEHKGCYGSPRIALQLYDEGSETNKRVVARLMRELCLCAKGYHKRRANHGKQTPIEAIVKANLLQRNFNQQIMDNVWVTDITYITCSDGRLYLSTYIDLTTRIPKCFEVNTHMKKSIVINPLIQYKKKLPNIIHSDRGSQYCSFDYQSVLESNHIRHSMSAPGTPVDNAVIESYHRTIKRELIIPNKNREKAELKILIYDYLTQYYSNKRIYTKFKMTPSKYEQTLLSVIYLVVTL